MAYTIKLNRSSKNFSVKKVVSKIELKHIAREIIINHIGRRGPAGPQGAPGEGAILPWESGTSYTVGNQVQYEEKAYIAIDDTLGDQPDTSTDKWLLYIGGGSGSGLPNGGTEGQFLIKQSSTDGDAEFQDLPYQLNGTYMNIFTAITGGDMTDSTFALTFASYLPAPFKMYVFDGVNTPYVVQCGPSPYLLENQPKVGDMFFSHQKFTFSSAVTPGSPEIDSIGRIWYVGGDVGPASPHDITVGNETKYITDADHRLFNEEFVFVDATVDIEISVDIPISSLSNMPVNGHGEFRILRIDTDNTKTVTLVDTEGKTFDGASSVDVPVGARLHYIHNGTEWISANPSSSGSLALSDLTDVSDSLSPTTGDVLTYDGGEWISDAPGAGTDNYSEFIYNSSVAATGNRFDDWSLLMAKLDSVAGLKRVTFERDETLPTGTYVLDNVIFSGDGVDFSLGGYSVTLPDGFNVSSWNNGEISRGIRVIYTGNDSLVTYTGGNRVFYLRDGGAIRTTNASFFDIQSTANFYPVMADESTVQNGGYAPITVNTSGNVWLFASGYVTNLGNNIFRGDISGGSGKILIGSPATGINPARTDASLTGTMEIIIGSDSKLVSYDNTISGLSSDNVKEAIDEIAAGGGGGAVTSVNTQTGVVVLDTDDISDTATNRYTNDTDITRLANTSGTNTGDQDLSGLMVKASNLSDVSSASTAFSNIKQSATDSATGVVELATQSEVDTGTDTTRVVTPDTLSGSPYGSKSASVYAIEGSTAVTTGDGKAYMRIPSTLNGMNLVSCSAAVIAKSTSGTPTIQLARGRQSTATSAHTFADMLSTRITIDANEYDSKDATTAPVIDTANDDVLTGDLIRIDVDVAGTGTTGLIITLTFKAP